MVYEFKLIMSYTPDVLNMACLDTVIKLKSLKVNTDCSVGISALYVLLAKRDFFYFRRILMCTCHHRRALDGKCLNVCKSLPKDTTIYEFHSTKISVLLDIS